MLRYAEEAERQDQDQASGLQSDKDDEIEEHQFEEDIDEIYMPSRFDDMHWPI